MSVKVCLRYVHKVYTKDEGQSFRKNEFGLCGCEMSVKVCALYVHKVHTRDGGQLIRDENYFTLEMSVKVCVF